MKKKRPSKSAATTKKKKKGIPTIILIAAMVAGLIAGLLGVLVMERRHVEKVRKHESTQHKAQHGGVVSMVGHRKYELVMNDNTVAVYIADDKKPAASEGGSVSLRYLVGPEEETVRLLPAGGNKFEGTRPFRLTHDTNVGAK